MDLILQSDDGEDIAIVSPESADLAYGVGDDPGNDMELTMPVRSPSVERGMFLYAEGTDYGGMITGVSTQSGLLWRGRTWFGLLASKVLVPDGGVGALTVSGNANDVLSSLLARIGLSGVMTASAARSPLTIEGHTFDMYQDALNGIAEMLAEVGGKLKVVHNGTRPVLSAVPAKDWSTDEAFDADQVSVTVDIDYLPVNHLVARGEGEGEERISAELYMDDEGNVSTSSQSLTAELDNSEYYNYTNADEETLIKDGTKRLKGYFEDSRTVSVALEASQDAYDIGDTVGGTDPKTGISASAVVVKKIVKIDGRGRVTVEYETGAI